MTKLNVSLDSPSPLLLYTPPQIWRPLRANEDTPGAIAAYANGSTAAVSQHTGGRMDFSFNGTGIWIYGAKRDNHGFYNVTLDGEDKPPMDGHANPDQFKALLFSALNLSPGPHSFSVVDTGPFTGTDPNRIWFDIDWITFETDFEPKSNSSSNSTTTVLSNTYSSSNSSLNYQPEQGNWATCSYTGVVSGTCMSSTNSGDSVNLTFIGDAIALYGGVGPNHGNYLVSIDGRQPEIKSANYDYIDTHEQVLYYVNSLGPGKHTIYVENESGTQANASQNVFELDYIRTWGLEGETKDVPPSSPASRTTNVGAIAGGVVGGVVALILIAAFIFVISRRRRRRKEVFEEKEARIAPDPFVQDTRPSFPTGAGVTPLPHTVQYSNTTVPRNPGQTTMMMGNPLSLSSSALLTSSSARAGPPTGPTLSPSRPQPFTKSSVVIGSSDRRPAPAATTGGTNSNSNSNLYSTTPLRSPSPSNTTATYSASDVSASSRDRILAPSTSVNTTTVSSQLPTTPEEGYSSDRESRARALDYGPLVREGDPYGVPELPPDYEHAQQPWERLLGAGGEGRGQ